MSAERRWADANRPLLDRGEDEDDESGTLLNDVVSEIVERDRQWMQREVVRTTSFIWGVTSALCAGSITAFSIYGPLFLSRLHYSQFQVNAVAVGAEISMYLPVPIFGYLCDRYTPRPISFLSVLFFCPGYILAGFAYQSGPPRGEGGDGWPFWVMLLAFICIGAGTCCMYLAAVTTCAKNFGRGKYKGIMLALPIAAFGLSGMWQSQVGTHLLYERLPDGTKGEVDVFRYFIFLGILLSVVGAVGAFMLRIVDEEYLIDEAVEDLERSGVLDEGDFFRSRDEVQAALDSSYGTFPDNQDDEVSLTPTEEDKRRKTWLLNYETRLFLQDRIMWLLAIGFFLVTGPGEAYINNVGTIIDTLTPRDRPPGLSPPAGSPSTHVSTIAITSTVARLLTGSLSDLFAPSPAHPTIQPPSQIPSTSYSFLVRARHTLTLSRMAFLIPSALVLSVGYLLLASPLVFVHPPLATLTTALIGLGYGSSFALVPIVISVVWGVENFGTNWGIVAMFPAGGAALYGALYSLTYSSAAVGGHGDMQGRCVGWACYGSWAAGCMGSVLVATALWLFAWLGWKRRGIVV